MSGVLPEPERDDNCRVAGGPGAWVLSERGELVAAPATPTGFKASARVSVIRGRCGTVPVRAQGCDDYHDFRGDLVCVTPVAKQPELENRMAVRVSRW